MTKKPIFFYLRGPIVSLVSEFQERIARIYWNGLASIRAVRDCPRRDLPEQCGQPLFGLSPGKFRWNHTSKLDAQQWIRLSMVRSSFEQLWLHHRFLWTILKLEDPLVRKQLHTVATYGNGIASCVVAHRERKRWPECVLGTQIPDFDPTL